MADSLSTGQKGRDSVYDLNFRRHFHHIPMIGFQTVLRESLTVNELQMSAWLCEVFYSEVRFAFSSKP